MNIEFIEIQNFRKLQSVRIDFAINTTVFVGANNSGKTSAMVALSHFLIDHNRFTTNDFTLSNWKNINKIGEDWEKRKASTETDLPTKEEWFNVLPSMDVWLKVSEGEIHHVNHLLPSLEWSGGLIGVRLRLEPKKVGELYKEYIQSRKAADSTIAAAKELKKEEKYTLSLWPKNMSEFLVKKLNTSFTVRAYILDPKKLNLPKNGIAQTQSLPNEASFLDRHPFKGLIRIDEINAQRGFTDANNNQDNDPVESDDKSSKRKLSDQLRSYYSKHIDPSEIPEPSDIDALQAIHTAQTSFDEKLKTSFHTALEEIGNLGYPGITDLELIISTKIRPMDGLNHPSALQYKVPAHSSDDESHPSLPEQYNGLGYQNLISMVFRLMSFRDHWMQVGKSSKKAISSTSETTADILPPLHLVLVEEPEAHLHVQVQQVFIRKAYEILRRHDDLGEKTALSTQLIVTTHSSHIAHECEFSWLRYFRRKAAKIGEVPTTTVVNLSEVFGLGKATEKFVTRYLKSTHCDLFFADAAILVEGSVERMLVPHFIRQHFDSLHKSYITLLEIGGSHAHQLRTLLEHLGLTTLIITDIDAAQINLTKNLISTVPERGKQLVTGNSTIRNWLPGEKNIDILLDIAETKKIKIIDDFSSVRVAYQCPIKYTSKKEGKVVEALANTFEDALVFENIEIFPSLNGKTGLLKKFKKAVTDNDSPLILGRNIFDFLKEGDKAQFALDILYEDPKVLKVPKYINEGLLWLVEQLKRKELELLVETHLDITTK